MSADKQVRKRASSIKQLSIRGLLETVAIVAIGPAYLRYRDPLNTYRRTGSQTALVDAIRGRLSDGMDRASIISILGEPIDPTIDVRIQHRRNGYISMVRKVAPLNPTAFPDGILANDEFLSFSCVSATGKRNIETLHFRDGKLINFSTQWLYDDDEIMTGLN